MDYLPCDSRKKIVRFQRDGSQPRIQTCTHPEADMGTEAVTPEDCEACPFRKFTKPIEGPKPALVKLGEVRRITRTQPDREPSDFPACPHRLIATVALCCGETAQHRVCDSPDCHHYAAEVSAPICMSCPLRTNDHDRTTGQTRVNGMDGQD